MLKKIVFFLLIISLSICNFSYCINDLYIESNSYISYERNTKNVLFGKNIDKKVPMASTTKIMTAILTIELGKMSEITIASKKAQNTNGQQLNLKEGDKISINDLLYAIMLYSANDGAVVLAEHIGGTTENFCNMMNEKARKIGAYNTNFTSPHGLDDPDHYSTPYDLALIMDYALNLNTFRNVISTQNYIVKINGEGKSIKNTNRLLNNIEDIVGGKTGYTGMAQYCLVCNMKNSDIDVISVVLKSPTSNKRFKDSKNILQYTKENYKILKVDDFIKNEISVKIGKTFKENVTIMHKKNNYICIFKNDIDKINVKYSILDKINAPINEKSVLGIANIYVNNNKIMEVPYYTYINIVKNDIKGYMSYIAINLVNILKIR